MPLDTYKTTSGTADALIKTGKGSVAGVIVTSHTSGTFKIWDNTSAATTVLTDTWTLAAGPQVITFPKPLEFYTGLYMNTGGTIAYTIVWK